MTMLTGRFGMAEPTPVERPMLARWVATTKLWHHQYSQYALVAITLQDEDPLSSPPPAVQPGATHAISSVTLNPSHPYADEQSGIYYLLPPNLEAQFTCESDERAVQVLEAVVEEVLEGNLNPESARPNLNVEEWLDFINGVLET